MEPMMLDVRSIGGFTDDDLFALCATNKTLRIERTAQGEIMLLHPTGGESGRQNTDIITDLNLWVRRTKSGIAFESSTGFRLPNTAVRSPDAAFVAKERWEALSLTDRKKFIPLCPDFVIELLSESDSLSQTRRPRGGPWCLTTHR